MNSLRIIRTVAGMRHVIKAQKAQGLSVGFVPTMGALHNGHASLLKVARKEVNVLVSSIYTNPTQFENKIDLDRYPKTENNDLKLLKQENTDFAFIPQTDDIYHELEVKKIDYGTLTNSLEGAHRPGHFDGMSTIVRKMIQIISPDKAYLGEKDWQQLAIINRMSKIERLGAEIIGCPIIRETSGLAMSSRNTRLSDSERTAALSISKSVFSSREGADNQTTKETEENIRQRLIDAGLKPDYVKIVNAESLEEVQNLDVAGEKRILIAAYAGIIRLIDNGPI